MKLLFLCFILIAFVIAIIGHEQKLLRQRDLYIYNLPPEARFRLPACLFRQVCKRLFDIFFSVTVLLTVFPVLFIIIAPLVKLSSPGPVFFAHKRLGLYGKLFKCYKFRTMYQNSGSAPVKVNDTRITRLGKLLRKTHLDEFPQFFNVLIGEMSIVGPRPFSEIVYQKDLTSNISFLRLTVRPGITGLAQMNVPRNYNPKRTIQNDLYYIRRLSLWRDIQIVFRTLQLKDNSY